ncbi:protein of unknown function (plasmid) [Azospirillum lipoferum 4B]|uniref:Uncharacterized protein n=1 Tax=Azospirillum lipoferum (strain 4B) TaxID=862719 RepID=G7ZHM9_AZOL4|nr:protein of unknown function [Azospirillum lipoferum 4B]
MRAVTDHHVDRRHVEGRQRLKLSLTNRSIGLISTPHYRAMRSSKPAKALLDARTAVRYILTSLARQRMRFGKRRS